jgi:hypothetical protein
MKRHPACTPAVWERERVHLFALSVNWSYVIVLSLIVFVCTLVGTFLSFRHIFGGAVITALLFAVAYVFWTYYPHGLPLPTKPQEIVPTAPAPPPPAASGKPDIR